MTDGSSITYQCHSTHGDILCPAFLLFCHNILSLLHLLPEHGLPSYLLENWLTTPRALINLLLGIGVGVPPWPNSATPPQSFLNVSIYFDLTMSRNYSNSWFPHLPTFVMLNWRGNLLCSKIYSSSFFWQSTLLLQCLNMTFTDVFNVGLHFCCLSPWHVFLIFLFILFSWPLGMGCDHILLWIHFKQM